MLTQSQKMTTVRVGWIKMAKCSIVRQVDL
jgi:hypothetical protein